MSTDDHRYALPKEGPASCTGCAWKSRPIGISSLTQHEEHRKAVAAAADQPTTEPRCTCASLFKPRPRPCRVHPPQPTTEPSKSRDDLVRLARMTADAFEDLEGPYGDIDAFGGGERFTVADLRSLVDLAAAAPQPAADTERAVREQIAQQLEAMPLGTHIDRVSGRTMAHAVRTEAARIAREGTTP